MMDMIASEYGFEALSEIYPDEVVRLLPHLKQRRITEYKMQLAIVQNPHSNNPKELWELLNQEERKQTNPVEEVYYDRDGLMALKSLMSQGGGIEVK